MTTEYFKVRNGLSVGEDTFTVDAATGDVVVGGNLTVNGEATTLNTTELSIEDNKITLNKNVTGAPNMDAGIVVERGSSTDSAITWNESTDKWEQNRGGTSTVIPVSTTELAEGTNQYFTAQRAVDAVETAGYATESQVADKLNTADFTSTADGWLGTKSTTNVSEGSNKYYTDARVRAEINGGNPGSFIGLTASGAIDLLDSVSIGDATKTGYQGVEFNSNNKTANLSIDPSTGKLMYSKDAVTYTPIAQSTTELAEGTNLYYTDARVGNYLNVNSWATQEYVGVQVANLIASAPSALNTLNELATALGNDANFSTTITTALGTKLATADFASTFDTRLATKSTSNLGEGSNLYHTTARARSAISASGSLSYDSSTGVVSYTTPTTSGITEGSNLYYTDARARAAHSAGTGVSYNSSTGVISIGQAVGTSDSPTFAGLTNPGNYVRGAIRNSTTAAAGDIWALNSTGSVTPFRGISLDNSADTTRGPGEVLRSFSGGAVSGSATRGRILFEKARGTSASPTAVQNGDFLGSIDATGYTSTGWLNDNIAAVTPSFFGFQAAENWVSNTNLGTTFALTLTPTATTITSTANLIPVFGINPQGSAMRSDTYTFSQGKSGTTTYFSMDSSKASFAIPTKFVSMSTAQRDALTPAGGWVIWNASTLKLQCYDGTTWNDLF